MNEEKIKELTQLLNANHTWPEDYCFKFIVPENQISTLRHLFPKDEFQTKPSRTGKYISVSLVLNMESSAAVLKVYDKVKNIEGLIAL